MSRTDAADGSEAVAADRQWSEENWLLIGLFSLLTAIGVAISTGVLDLGLTEAPKSFTGTASVEIPVFVYLYSSLGALGYAFTRLMTRLEDFDEWGEIEKLVEMGLRIPAAWILAAGFHLVVVGTSAGSPDPTSLAGLAFLVGLYVNVAFKSLGSVADRVLGRSRPG